MQWSLDFLETQGRILEIFNFLLGTVCKRPPKAEEPVFGDFGIYSICHFWRGHPTSPEMSGKGRERYVPYNLVGCCSYIAAASPWAQYNCPTGITYPGQ